MDNCGNCDDDSSNNCLQDCAGNWGGSARLDNCGTCDSNSTNDCAEVVAPDDSDAGKGSDSGIVGPIVGGLAGCTGLIALMAMIAKKRKSRSSSMPTSKTGTGSAESGKLAGSAKPRLLFIEMADGRNVDILQPDGNVADETREGPAAPTEGFAGPTEGLAGPTEGANIDANRHDSAMASVTDIIDRMMARRLSMSPRVKAEITPRASTDFNRRNSAVSSVNDIVDRINNAEPRQ